MDDRNTPNPLDDLSQRLARAKQVTERVERKARLSPDMPNSGLGIAFRVGVELVAGVVVGVAVGYGLDRWLGTSPWLLIVFFLLGSAGGMLNVWRAMSGKGLAAGYAKPGNGTDRRPDDETKREG
ncbi:MAG: AtpZ/AtpI family protein [Alphaproteobacteria bacterium]|nr:AtpZ/AtpI family protein [Alphaproteobacteria bacterium]